MKQIQSIYFGIVIGSLILSIGLQLILPFPFGLIVALAIFILLPAILNRIMKNKFGDIGFSQTGPRKMDKTCLRCGLKTNKAQCHRCGSQQFSYK